MPISVTCVSCGTTLKAPDTFAGRQASCPKCKTKINVPAVVSASPMPVAAMPAMAVPAVPRTSGGGVGIGTRFTFDGSAGDFFVTALLAGILTVFTFYLGMPWAICMVQRWKADHTRIDGRRLKFTGTGGQLFVKFIVWALLCMITFYIYMFWAVPKWERWKTEHLEFADA
jgi:uncharacterized membrane protein YjgN (DUF898 family)